MQSIERRFELMNEAFELIKNSTLENCVETRVKVLLWKIKVRTLLLEERK